MDHPETPGTYIDTAYLRTYTMGFDELVKIENSKQYQDSTFFKPQLMNTIKLLPGEYLVKLSFMGISPDRQPVK
ncbi:hypothetical protein CLV51_101914 [Chitinophaga niastensis]|uniref:Uncharacterized protein n=2 Tax=Chitinophaga niastensis TaxID=536980 RepID=A0A2P8HTM0_CHINA|nr:hypothetical protein CLV51_101914 [Chitinophaga niastensis]